MPHPFEMTRDAAVIDRGTKSRHDATEYLWVDVGDHGDGASPDLGQAVFDRGGALWGQRLRRRDLRLDDTQMVEQSGALFAQDL